MQRMVRQYTLITCLLTITSIMSTWRHHCLRCSKFFATESDVLCHMNNPVTKCLNWLNGLRRVSTPDPSHTQHTAASVAMGSFLIESRKQPRFDNELDDSGDFDMEAETRRDNYNIEMYEGTAEKYGGGKSFLNNFDSDWHAYERKCNVYYPLASKNDWELASWLL